MNILKFLSTVAAPGPTKIEPQSLHLELEKHLQGKLKVKELSTEDYLLKAGQTSELVCFIQTGLLRCFYITDTGKEVSRWFMKEGDVAFSIRSFYTQKPGKEYIQAIEPTELYYITYDELDEIYLKFPEFRTIGHLLTIKYHMQWDEKDEAVTTKSAGERYDWLVTNHPKLLDRVTARHLSSWLGITEVTFSNEKSKKMEK